MGLKKSLRRQAKVPSPGRLNWVPQLSSLDPLCPRGLPLPSPSAPLVAELVPGGQHRTAPGWKGGGPGLGGFWNSMRAVHPTPPQGEGPRGKGQRPHQKVQSGTQGSEAWSNPVHPGHTGTSWVEWYPPCQHSWPSRDMHTPRLPLTPWPGPPSPAQLSHSSSVESFLLGDSLPVKYKRLERDKTA